MRERSVERCELEDLKRLVIRFRPDWPAVFSTNVHREIWPFCRWGLTEYKSREPVRGVCKLLDQLADEFLEIREGGGRFFIDPQGVFYKDEFSEFVKVISFKIYA